MGAATRNPVPQGATPDPCIPDFTLLSECAPRTSNLRKQTKTQLVSLAILTTPKYI